MRLLGASGNSRRPVNATNGAPQRSLGKANPLRAWFGTYLWDRRRTSPMGLLLTLDATLMSARIRRMTGQFDVVLRRIRYNNQQVNLNRVEPSWRTRRVNRSRAL